MNLSAVQTVQYIGLQEPHYSAAQSIN